MKLLFTLFISLNFTIVFAQQSDKNELLDCFWASIKSDNDSMILNCIPNRQELIVLTELAKANTNKPIPSIDSIQKNISLGAIENISRLKQKAVSKSINWNSIRVDSIVSVSLEPEFNVINRENIKIFFTQNDIQYVLILSKCIYVSERWRIMDKLILMN